MSGSDAGAAGAGAAGGAAPGEGSVTEPVTGEPGTGEPASEDQEGAGLLSGMLANDPEALARELTHWKTMARKNEDRAKQNAAAATELKSIKEQNMSELEKAQTAQREAEEARDAAMNTHARVMAAAANNLPADLIDHLGSGTDQEINERAELFARVIDARARELADEVLSRNGMPAGTLGSGRPLESLRPGSAPAAGGTPSSPDEWFRRLVTGS